jgi:molybdopterin/thiamine biosynthesis adenylyltransferase
VSTIISYPDRDLRQREIVPPAKLARCHGLIIGVGAIGRQVALQLAAVGVPKLELVDHDVVAVENLAPQGYWPQDLGQPKVEATAAACRLLNPDVHVTLRPDRFRRSSPKELSCFADADSWPLVFCCVDSIECRRIVWAAVRERTRFFCDGRMAAEVVRVLAWAAGQDHDHYPTTLFPASQAYRGSCTSRSTIYAASIAAGLMLAQFTRWLRGLPLERDQCLNLLAGELTCG